MPQQGPGAEPRWGSRGKVPRSWRHMLNIQLNKAIDHHIIAYCSESDYTLKKFPAARGDMHHIPSKNALITILGTFEWNDSCKVVRVNVLQVNAATDLTRGGIYNSFFHSSSMNAAVKELLKLVHTVKVITKRLCGCFFTSHSMTSCQRYKHLSSVHNVAM